MRQPLKKFLNTFDISDLEIDLASLPSDFLNVTPPQLIVEKIRELLRYHSSNRKIKLYEIKNLISSDHGQEIINVLKFWKYKILVTEEEKLPEILQENNTLIEKTQTDQNYSHENNSEENYNRGYLTRKDVQFIKEQKLSSPELATLSNGYYASFSDLSLYDHYKKEDLTSNVDEIIYNAILSEARMIDYSADIYYLVGNIPRFLSDYVNYDNDIKKLFKSFVLFIELSGVRLQ